MLPNLESHTPSRHLRSGLASLLFLALLLAPLARNVGNARAGDSPQFVLKLATLAPENSVLMQVFEDMNAEVIKETGGKVGFKMFAGFVLGDEEDVLRKLRAGVVQGAAFTSSALTDIDPDLRVLMIPFLFKDYKEVDFIMNKLDTQLKKGFADKGYVVLGWPEMGFMYFMSTEPVAGLDDLKGKRVWAKSNAPMSKAIIDRAEVATVAVNAPDILMALQTNVVDVVYNSPYYAVVTQWYTQIKYLTDLPLSYMGGALLVDRKAFSKIPAPLQETVKKVCATYTHRLVEKTRQDNAAAMDTILKRGVKEVTPTAAQVEGFKKLSDAAMDDLGPKYLPPATLKSVREWLAQYRSGAAPGK